MSAIYNKTVSKKEGRRNHYDFEKQSEEYEALMYFKNRSEEIWSENEKIFFASRSIQRKTVGDIPWSEEFDQKVPFPIDRMKYRTDKFLDPFWGMDEDSVQHQKEICTAGKYSPHEILAYLHNILVTSCNAPFSPSEAQDIAVHRAYLLRILLRFNVYQKTVPDPGLFLSKFLPIYDQLPFNKRYLLEDELGGVFKRFFPTIYQFWDKTIYHLWDESMDAFFDEIRSRAGIEKSEISCRLRDAIYMSNFDYNVVRYFVLHLKMDLINLSYLAGVCADVMYHGDFESINKYTKNISDTVTQISSFTSKWLSESLPSSWPSAHHQMLREQVTRNMSKKGYSDSCGVLKTATNVTQLRLRNMGFSEYIYETLIVKTSKKENEVYFEGISNYCSQSDTENDFDTVICRIPLNSTDEQEKLKLEEKMQRLRDLAQKLDGIIQSELESLHNILDLGYIAGELKTKIGKEFIAENDFHGWTIVRQWSKKDQCPSSIDYYSSFNNSDTKNILTFKFTNRELVYQRCEDFQIFFFV